MVDNIITEYIDITRGCPPGYGVRSNIVFSDDK